MAGLKEQDLPSDPPSAAGSSSTLSESQKFVLPQITSFSPEVVVGECSG